MTETSANTDPVALFDEEEDLVLDVLCKDAFGPILRGHDAGTAIDHGGWKSLFSAVHSNDPMPIEERADLLSKTWYVNRSNWSRIERDLAKDKVGDRRIIDLTSENDAPFIWEVPDAPASTDFLSNLVHFRDALHRDDDVQIRSSETSNDNDLTAPECTLRVPVMGRRHKFPRLADNQYHLILSLCELPNADSDDVVFHLGGNDDVQRSEAVAGVFYGGGDPDHLIDNAPLGSRGSFGHHGSGLVHFAGGEDQSELAFACAMSKCRKKERGLSRAPQHMEWARDDFALQGEAKIGVLPISLSSLIHSQIAAGLDLFEYSTDYAKLAELLLQIICDAPIWFCGFHVHIVDVIEPDQTNQFRRELANPDDFHLDKLPVSEIGYLPALRVPTNTDRDRLRKTIMTIKRFHHRWADDRKHRSAALRYRRQVTESFIKMLLHENAGNLSGNRVVRASPRREPFGTQPSSEVLVNVLTALHSAMLSAKSHY